MVAQLEAVIPFEIVGPYLRVPTMENVMQAVWDGVAANFDAAAAVVAELAPGEAAPLEAPRGYRLAGAGYPMPTKWPTLVIGSSNLRRFDAQNTTRGARWKADLELHVWCQDGKDFNRLMRTLQRQAAAMWIVVTSADAQHALGGASLEGDTMTISAGQDPAQTEGQQSIVLRFTVSLKA